MRGAQTHLHAPATANAPDCAIPRVVLRAYFMEEAAFHPVFPLGTGIVARGFESESSVLTRVPQSAANPAAITAQILHAEAVTGWAHHIASTALQAPVAHLLPEWVLHASGGDASHR